MRRGMAFTIAGGVVLLALAGCGRSYLLQGERPAWRHEAEETCLKSGAVQVGVVQIDPIEGPGMCGADFPFKVSALGEAPAMSYADDLRPPGAIPNAGADMPRWPPTEPRYAPPARVAPVQAAPLRGETLRWVPGPPGVDIRHEGGAPAGQPMSLSPDRVQPLSAPQTIPSRAQPMSYPRPLPAQRASPDDIPDDAVVPPGGSAGAPQRRTQPAYNAPPQRRELPRLGPARAPNMSAIPPATLQPAATLACPIVSALDRWVSEGVQPAALHWFHSPVMQIHQIGSYACRGMVGGSGVSEHSFGNALDIAGFTLADGRKITVKNGWHGTPEEQGFLHDVQLYACETFTTVLAPGYNIYHYDHIHVDLMRRESGRRPCRPDAIPGEVVAARARAHYASQHRSPAITGSIGAQTAGPTAIPGADGYVTDEDAKRESEPVAVPAYLGRREKMPNEDRLAIH
jgi:Extensin-like protein C-terminus